MQLLCVCNTSLWPRLTCFASSGVSCITCIKIQLVSVLRSVMNCNEYFSTLLSLCLLLSVIGFAFIALYLAEPLRVVI